MKTKNIFNLLFLTSAIALSSSQGCNNEPISSNNQDNLLCMIDNQPTIPSPQIQDLLQESHWLSSLAQSFPVTKAVNNTVPLTYNLSSVAKFEFNANVYYVVSASAENETEIIPQVTVGGNWFKEVYDCEGGLILIENENTIINWGLVDSQATINTEPNFLKGWY